MKQEFVRLYSADNIEMPGVLSSPDSGSDTIVLHVHGLNGNFYENRFLDVLAKTYTEKGCAFLAFNNRGKDYVCELLKGDDYVIIGGSCERFADCVLDLDGAVAWAKERGYSKIILEGHSYGCNKVAYYYNQRKDASVEKIVLLAPCDIPAEPLKFMASDDYAKTKAEAERCVAEGKAEELVNYSVMTGGRVAARTFCEDFLPGGPNDFIRYREGSEGASEVLRSLDVPVLVVFGDADECVKTEPIETVKAYLANNIRDCKICVIEGASHSYKQRFAELGEIIRNN